jgi:hypothetical protein
VAAAVDPVEADRVCARLRPGLPGHRQVAGRRFQLLDATAALLEAMDGFGDMSGRRCGMILPDLSRAGWRRSRYSGSNGNCVETAGDGRVVAVRDSNDSAGRYLAFKPSAWREFAARLKDDE